MPFAKKDFVTKKGTEISAGKIVDRDGTTVWIENFEGILESMHKKSIRPSTEAEYKRALEKQSAEYEEHPNLFY